ncbi:hypothetical protein [Kribbella sp. HUAS MG21]|uniref:Uncharacterized protein n=1 Tax=Kribbella sp. HUAS MG21 TaxID=3160966 RepID=A0AAU7TFS4_9ACTN
MEAAGVHRIARRDRSGADREYLVAVPDGPVRGVTVLFHPFGFTPEAVLFGEPAGDLLIRPLAGALAPAAAAGQVVVAPRSRGRVLGGISLAWQDHLDGSPSEGPAEYARRSPISYAATLAATAVRLVWSPADTVIPGQASDHAHALADKLRAAGGQVDERIVTYAPVSPKEDPGRYAHEACDIWEHLAQPVRFLR